MLPVYQVDRAPVTPALIAVVTSQRVPLVKQMVTPGEPDKAVRIVHQPCEARDAIAGNGCQPVRVAGLSLRPAIQQASVKVMSLFSVRFVLQQSERINATPKAITMPII
jgi:hypothetical protein